MPGENENFEGGLDAVAESLFVGSDDAPAPKTPVNPSNRVAEGDDQVDESDVDNSVDEADIDLLEGGDEADEDFVDDNSVDVDPDDVEHEVTVDGQPTKAKLKDLKAAFSGNKAIEQRVQQAGEFRKQQEVITTELMKQLNVQAAKLKQLDEVLAQVENNPIDWETLRVTNPTQFLIEKEKQREIQANRQKLADAQRDTQKQQWELNERRKQEYAANQAEILTQKMPELKDPNKAKKISESWDRAAAVYGFEPEEIANVMDHRQLLVLTDAMKYRALVAAKAARSGKNGNAIQRTAPKPLLRPGSQNGNMRSAASKAEKAAAAKAAQTGTLDDVAASLITQGRRPAQKRTGF